MRIQRHKAVQVHPVPAHIRDAQGPFPRELFIEPEIVDVHDTTEFGENLPLGSTAQNNFIAPRMMVCSLCKARVLESKTGEHEC
jgi:hypothetical protein